MTSEATQLLSTREGRWGSVQLISTRAEDKGLIPRDRDRESAIFHGKGFRLGVQLVFLFRTCLVLEIRLRLGDHI